MTIFKLNSKTFSLIFLLVKVDSVIQTLQYSDSSRWNETHYQ